MIYSLKKLYLQELKGMQRSKLGMGRRTINYINGVGNGKALDRGAKPPRMKLC